MMFERLPPEILDRLPPQDLAAEKGVIGSILLDPSLMDEVAGMLRPNEFCAEANRKLYGHILGLHDARQPVDVVLLVGRLKAAGDIEAIGGTAYIAECAQSVPYGCNAMYYARIVRECAQKRAMIRAATEMLRDAYDESQPTTAVLERAESALAGIVTEEGEGEPVPIQVAMHEAQQRLEETRERGGSAGLLTGLYDFDTEIGGLFPGELTILAARPSVGKTSLACQWMAHVAEHQHMVYFASLEMSRDELAMKLACSRSGVSHQRVRTGKLSDEDYAGLAKVMCEVSAWPIKLHDKASMSGATIRRAARRFVRDGLALVVVDYLQLIDATNAKINRDQQVGEMTKALKALARELSVPVLVLCQLNRATEQQERPILANLRESGNIEQDADVVMFLCRPKNGFCDLDPKSKKPVDGGDRWDGELIVAKNRLGATRPMKLDWNKQTTTFCGHGQMAHEEFEAWN